MGTLSYIRMVLWSFFGIRRQAAAEEELTRVKPAVLVAVAVALATIFGLTLWALASIAVHMLSSAEPGSTALLVSALQHPT